MCQEFPKEKWVDARREDILDAPYFHVVFTVPEELNPIIYSNQKFLYAALYHAASDTLSELAADSKYLGTDKHKAIIATMYSSGLRVSEVVHLHYDDISRTNMTIHVRETKGRIDRYTILSQKNLDLLTEYWYKCGRPKDILFPSSWTGGYLDIASVNQFFKKSAKLAGITRHVSSHACRHSFASHLFESGTDIKYIQSLLGHVDPRSTDVYLHVSNKTLLGIRSPFDNPEGGES